MKDQEQEFLKAENNKRSTWDVVFGYIVIFGGTLITFGMGLWFIGLPVIIGGIWMISNAPKWQS